MLLNNKNNNTMPRFFNYAFTPPHSPNSAPVTPTGHQHAQGLNLDPGADFPDASYQSPLPTIQDESLIIPHAPIAAHNPNTPIMIPPPFFIFRCTNTPIKQTELHDTSLDHDDVIDAFLSDIKGFTADQIRDFQCPITQSIFKDPVIASDGNTYEYDALLAYVESIDNPKKVKSPITKQPLSPTLTRNNAIQKILNSFIQEINDTNWCPTEKENTPLKNSLFSRRSASFDHDVPLKRARK